MKQGVAIRGWCLGGALLLCALAALGGRRTSAGYEIRPDEIDAGGSRRQSDSFLLRDVIGSQPAGVVRSATYESRGGYSYLTGELKPGDLDENGLLDARDLFLFSLSWQRQPGEEPAYRRSADLVQHVKEPRVNEEDLLELIRRFRAE